MTGPRWNFYPTYWVMRRLPRKSTLEIEVLDFCLRWLETACTGDAPQEVVERSRQCAIARFEILAATAQEFQSMRNLGDFFEKLAINLRSEWSGPPQKTTEACDLPRYPAFL